MTWLPFVSVEPSEEKTIWLSRHGISEGNEADVVQHWHDYALTPMGREQAEQARAWWEATVPVEWVISSPVLRTRQTADILFGRIDDIDTGWAEQAIPAHVGLPVMDFYTQFPHLISTDGISLDLHPRTREMEHLDTVGSRAVDALLRAAQYSPADAKDIAVVSHGGVLGSLLRRAGMTLPRIHNLLVMEIAVSPLLGWQIRSIHSPLDYEGETQ